jgi:isopenicillin N synthase-like dioxygenase
MSFTAPKHRPPSVGAVSTDTSPGPGLPLIDLSPLVDGRPAGSTIEQIDAACRDVGFFLVEGHGIPEPVRTGALDAARWFFEHPVPWKERFLIDRSAHHRGWVPPERETLQPDLRGDNKEALDLGADLPADDPAVVDGMGLLGPNQWPDEPWFRAAIESYFAAVAAVAATVLQALALALDLEADHFARRMQRPACNLRLLHYPPQPGPAPDQLGCGAHTDYGLVTLLATDGNGGLEVQRRDGTWLAATAAPDVLVVNLGDMLARWTNDRYVSTPHRVVSPSGGHRYSMPFFVNPDVDAVVACIPSCAGPDRPARYEPIGAGAYLHQRFDATHAYRA